MPNIFDGLVDKSFHMVCIRKTNTDEYPTRNELNELDDAIAKLYGFAIRSGGGNEKSSSQYAIGYLLPKGVKIRLNQRRIINSINECSYFDDDEPFVTLISVHPSDDELGRGELIGTPPEEALSGLQSFADDFNDKHFK